MGKPYFCGTPLNVKMSIRPMTKIALIPLILLFFACKQEIVQKKFSAQEIVDRSIEVCGGNFFENSVVTFDFRDRSYISDYRASPKTLVRILETDTVTIKDIRTNMGFQRFINDTLVTLGDSLANVYSNSVNSVHYFAKLPYGLNDISVNKKLLGETTIKGKGYYKIQVTFKQAGGGDDFEDIYVYWINKASFKPDYLGYDFKTDGGGTRFRAAFNERYIGGIRFVDYDNFKPKDVNANILIADSLFNHHNLELLSKIELVNVAVNGGNYN